MNFKTSLVGWILEVNMDQNWNNNWIKNGVEKKQSFGGGETEKLMDMGVQGSSKSKIIIRFNYVLLYYYMNGVYTPMTQRVGGYMIEPVLGDRHD